MNRFISSVGLALLWAVSAFAQIDFSADIVSLSAASNTFHTRIFSTKDKLRFQQEVKTGRVESIMIVNLAAQTSIVLVPQQKQYIESGKPQIPGQGVIFFQAKNVDDACGEWESLIRLSEASADDDETPKKPHTTHRCQRIGHETVNGRDTIKYEDTAEKGESSSLWLDVKLHFPVKWKNNVATGELRNVKEEPQPAELFSIPAGYAKRNLTNPANSK